MALHEVQRLNVTNRTTSLEAMGFIAAQDHHLNDNALGNGKRNGRLLASSPDSFVYQAGLFVPGHVTTTEPASKEIQITIDFSERAKEKPKEYEDYLTFTKGEKRFDFANEKHVAATEYAHSAYKDLQVDVSESLREYADAEGLTIERLREQMMAGRSIVDGGTLHVPFSHHMPNKTSETGKQAGEEAHYEGDFFYWDNLWSVKWAGIKNDLSFAKGVMDNFHYEYNPVGYVPNSNKLKIADRSQPPVSGLVFEEIAKNLTDNEEDNQWRREKVSFMKSEYFHVWVDDREGEALYDTYDKKKGKKKATIWKNQAQTPTGLSRYSCADITANKYAGEAATGEDVGPRFNGEPEKYNPTDLAGLRAISQKVFRDEALRESNLEEASYWNMQFEKTKKVVNDVMWNEEKGWYMDYNFVDGKQGDVMALAAVMLVKADLVPEDRRNRMMKNYDKFALPYGLAVTSGDEPTAPGREGKESWKYPNRWAPREDIFFDSFMPYPEHHERLEELMIRSQIGTAEFVDKHDSMPEVLDAVTGEIGGSALYPRRPKDKGFLWTCVTYLENDRRLAEIYKLRDKQEDDSQDQVIYQSRGSQLIAAA